MVNTEIQARTRRETLLREADHNVNALEDLGKDASKWRSYRVELRDLTKQKGFPLKIKWPNKPE